jgi:cytochrome c-type biogenesis protein CcmH
MRHILLLLFVLVAAMPPAVSNAQALSGAALEEATRQLASELRCPVCQGLSIEDSPTKLSRQMRAVVRDQLAQGRTPEEVKAYFVSRYGEWVLLAPEPSGFNLLVYLLPIVGLIAGAIIIAISVRRWTHAGPPPSPAVAASPRPVPGERSE